jgi:DNA-binding response OmpR family regulator
MRCVKLLVVSRSARERAWVRGALGPEYAPTEATDGLAARDAARAETFDLVVCDELTEPYGGFGLARELKLLADPPAVIVLLDRAQDTWLAKWSGADRWLLQPVDPFDLAAAARELTEAPAPAVVAAAAPAAARAAAPAAAATGAHPAD